MQHNDIRHSLCYGCAAFVREDVGSKFICVENGKPLRLGKHKIPQKHQDCKGPHDDMESIVVAFDEFTNISDEQRAELYAALEHGKIDKTGRSLNGN